MITASMKELSKACFSKLKIEVSESLKTEMTVLYFFAKKALKKRPFPEAYLGLFQTSLMEISVKIVDGQKPLTISGIKFHRRCLIGFKMRLENILGWLVKDSKKSWAGR